MHSKKSNPFTHFIINTHTHLQPITGFIPYLFDYKIGGAFDLPESET